MLAAAFLPLFVTSAETPTTLEPPVATVTATAPDPTLPVVLAVTVADATMDAPDPAVLAGTVSVTTSADATMTAPDPDIIGPGAVLTPPTAEAAMTAPNPTLLIPVSIAVTVANASLLAVDPIVSYGFIVSSADPDFSGVPRDSTNPREHARQTANLTNRILQGKLNATATITLNANVTKTFWRDGRLSPTCVVRFDPMTANAATEQSAGTMYVLEDDRRAGQWVITHANDAADDRKFRVIIIG